MKKLGIFILFVLILLSIFLSIRFATVSAQSSGDINDPYPPPESLIQTPGLLGSQPLSSSTLAPYPGPITLPTPITSRSTQLINPLSLGNYKIFLPIIIKSYSPAAAITHADYYAHRRSGEFPNYGTGCDCNDCTNYISQSIYKGGVGLKTGNWNENSVYEWWYKANYIGPIFIGYSNSKTWSATDWFNTFLFQYSNEFEYRSHPTFLDPGDFFLMDLHGASLNDPPDGIPDHARFVVGYGYSSIDPNDYTCQSNPIPPSTYGLLVDQHCVDRYHVLWNFNSENMPSWSWHIK